MAWQPRIHLFDSKKKLAQIEALLNVWKFRRKHLHNQPRVADVSDQRQLSQECYNSELNLKQCCGFDGGQDSIGYCSRVPKLKTTFDRFLSADAKHYSIG